MQVNEGTPFLNALMDKSVRTKLFTVDSLVNIAYMKRKITNAVSGYQDTVSQLSVKAKVLENRYVAISDSEEHKKDFVDFMTKISELSKSDIPDLTLNFVEKAELMKVIEECSLDVKTILIIHLMKQ